MNKKELIKFWKSSLDPYPGFLFRIFEHCEIGHFSIIWLISLEILIECHEIIDVAFDMEVSIKVCKEILQ